MSASVSSCSHICTFYSSTFYALYTMSILCTMPLHVLHCATLLPFRLFIASHSPLNVASNQINTLFYVLHIFYTSSPLHDHHGNSLYSMAVMLNVFIIRGHLLEIPWLFWQSQLFIFSGSYNQSSLASLASKPIPSRDHQC
jgi:hypothetical protein